MASCLQRVVTLIENLSASKQRANLGQNGTIPNSSPSSANHNALQEPHVQT